MHDSRDAIFKRVCDYYYAHYAEVKATELGGCLYWMQAGFLALQSVGLRPQIQAGTAHWRIIPPGMDDGVRATHFGFEWDPDHPASVKQRAIDMLPEMHCWLALTATNEIVDFSTHELPDIARKMGFFWHMPPPPDYLWVRADLLPPDMVYRPNTLAILFLLDFIKRKFLIRPETKGKI